MTINTGRLLPVKSENFEPAFLIHESFIENESANILFKLYNFQFDDVRTEIEQLRAKFPWHPVSYFIESLSYWWQLQDGPENLIDDLFLEKIESTIKVAESMHEHPIYSAEASFFLSASYGLKSQYMMERRNWAKSALAGRNSLSYLNEIRNKEDLSKEVLFGQGLFNYYVEYIPDAYPLLKPMTFFLPDGNIELGKKQLLEVYQEAFYTKVEAAVYLIEILDRGNISEKAQAKEILQNLINLYPRNPFFRNRLARF